MFIDYKSDLRKSVPFYPDGKEDVYLSHRTPIIIAVGGNPVNWLGRK
jgi:hypothetical protein